jgi:hypothetical protein
MAFITLGSPNFGFQDLISVVPLSSLKVDLFERSH